MDFQLGPAYDTKTMEESKIRERIKALIEKADAEATPQEYGEVMQGTLGLITLLYGSGSKQIASLERAVVEEQKRTLTLRPDQQRGGGYAAGSRSARQRARRVGCRASW
jgi:hypothetical protein